MKVGILGTKGVPGSHGVEVVVDSLLPHFANLGIRTTVFGYNSYTNDRVDYKNAEIVTVSGSDRKNYEMITHMYLSSMLTRKLDFDIIHIHSTDPCLMAWLPRARCGVVATSHGQAYLRNKWGMAARMMSKTAERIYTLIPDEITSVSKPLSDYYESKYKRDVTYIPNGVDHREPPSQAILNEFNLTPYNFLFCSAGRIERTKGIHTLLNAYEKLHTDIPLIIAGGGRGSDPAYYDELKKRAVTGVNFVGFLTGDNLFALYAYAKLFVFPSEYEAMSMALLEGLSFGTPTVFSDLPENRAVADGVAIPFSSGHSDSLAKQIEWALCNYESCQKMGEKAKQLIRSKHDWNTIAKQYHAIYTKLYQNCL